jgi:hypothetical protein
MDPMWIFAAIIGLMLLFWWKNKRPGYVGGGVPSEGSEDEGWVFLGESVEKPNFMDVNTKRVYQVKKYRELCPQPLTIEVEFETVAKVMGIGRKQILPVVFEEGVNEPWPSHKMGCSIPAQPSAWMFSQYGGIDPEQFPLAQMEIEKKLKEISQLKDELRKEKSQRKTDVRETVNLMQKFQGGLNRPMMPPM